IRSRLCADRLRPPADGQLGGGRQQRPGRGGARAPRLEPPDRRLIDTKTGFDEDLAMTSLRSSMPSGPFRWIILGLAVAAPTALAGDPAAAQARKKRPVDKTYRPPYAAIVVDANSGSVLHADNADAPRHPASLAKIMTLYLLFEQLEAGKLKLDQNIP